MRREHVQAAAAVGAAENAYQRWAGVGLVSTGLGAGGPPALVENMTWPARLNMRMRSMPCLRAMVCITS